MEPTNTVEQTGSEATPSQATETEAKPIQREEQAIGAVFDKRDAELAGKETELPGRKEEKRAENVDGGQQALEAPAHWSAEDRAFFKNQPVESQKFLLERNKALESDYGKKSQQLADKKRELDALSFLAEKMKHDDSFRDHVTSYGQKQQPSIPDKETPPDDPIEMIIWEAEKRFEQKLMAKENERKQQTHAEKVKATREEVLADPMFDQVQQGIANYILVQPKPVQELLYRQLDSDPDAYKEAYDFVKKALTGMAPSSGSQQQTDTKQPQPVRKETVHKPLIEQGGNSTEINTESKRFKDVRRKAASGDVASIGKMFNFVKK